MRSPRDSRPQFSLYYLPSTTRSLDLQTQIFLLLTLTAISMALTAFLRFVLFSVILALIASNVGAQVDHHSFQLMAEALEWPVTTSLSVPDSSDGKEGVDLNGGDDRRSLYWQHAEHYGHYYISYGALSANRIPCPPGSGRSYYTHDCYKATGPVRPYTRGCSCITRCRR